MKKFLALSAAVAIVASLQANTIEWSLPALTDGEGNDIDYTLNDIVFISTASPTSYDSTSGKITGTTPSGTNTQTDYDDVDKYIAGVWEDSLTGGGTYYMAYKGSDGTFYALEGASGAVTVTAPAYSVQGSLPTLFCAVLIATLSANCAFTVTDSAGAVVLGVTVIVGFTLSIFLISMLATSDLFPPRSVAWK